MNIIWCWWNFKDNAENNGEDNAKDNLVMSSWISKKFCDYGNIGGTADTADTNCIKLADPETTSDSEYNGDNSIKLKLCSTQSHF